LDISLPELLGHTPLQVLFGALLGAGMAYFCHNFLFLKML
jgi:acid phosphatase family membrane protein YuiD